MEAKQQRELLQSHGDNDWGGGQDLRCVNRPPWGAEAGIYQSFSGLLSVLFRTNQLFQELLFELVLLNLQFFFQNKSF